MLEKKLTPLGRLAARQLLSQLLMGSSPTSRVSIATQSAPRSVSIALQSAPRIPHHACRLLRNPLHATCRLHMQPAPRTHSTRVDCHAIRSTRRVDCLCNPLHALAPRVSIAAQSAPRSVSIASQSAPRMTHVEAARVYDADPTIGGTKKLDHLAPSAPAVLPQVLYGATHVSATLVSIASRSAPPASIASRSAPRDVSIARIASRDPLSRNPLHAGSDYGHVCFVLA